MAYIICKKCSKEFSSYDKRTVFCSKSCYNLFRVGENNPFYGKKHKQESISEMKKKLSDRFSGERNPFFGKTHSDEAIKKIKALNIKFRKDNYKDILLVEMNALGIDRDKILEIYNDYKTSCLNQKDISEKYRIDFRTIKGYLVKLELISEEELNRVTLNKKMNKSASSAENKLFLELKNIFQDKDIERQVKIDKYIYDFRIDDILIEYDGYYWHQVLSNNDDLKNELAKKEEYHLLRVIEPESRKVDLKKAAISIREFYETKKDTKYSEKQLLRFSS